MSLWFAQSDGPVTPSRAGKRCTEAYSARSDAAGRASAIAKTRAHYTDNNLNTESTTLYAPSGKKRVEDHQRDQQTSLVPAKLAERTTYSHTPWEHAKKRILRAPNSTSADNALSAPVPAEPVAVTPRREKQMAPFATWDQDPSKVTPARFQKRHVDTPLASTSVGEADYHKKRSRTPPTNVKPRCTDEGFCVLYSALPSEGGKVQHMAMARQTHHGKSAKHGEKDFMANRKEEDARAEKVAVHKRALQVERRNVDRPEPRPHGIRRVAGVCDSGAFRLQAPYAINLPTGYRYDDVGMSSVRARSQSPAAGSRRWR